MPEDYYPNSTLDIILLVAFLLLTVVGSFGLLIGLLFWQMNIGNPLFVLIWSIVLAVFTVLMFIIIYFGGKAKIRKEREMVRQRL